MTALAALTGPLPKLGVIVVAGLAATVLLAREPRARAAAICGALALAPTLLLADIWRSPQLRLIHRHPLLAAASAVAVLAVLASLAVVIARRPVVLAPLTLVALPFRIPIDAGGTTSNLLVPLYLVVAAGSLAFIVPALRGSVQSRRSDPAGWVERLIALYVVLYGIQSAYSSDFEKALQQMVFFYVPFALMFALMTSLQWTPRLVRACFALVVGLAVVFAGIGFGEYATKTIFLNPKLVVANGLHTYFTVNSVFFDPDIFGRFLALVMIGLAVLLVYDRGLDEAEPDGEHSARRVHAKRVVGATAILAVLWGGLVLTLSRSSLAALLLGLSTLAALRWHLRRTILIVLGVVAVGAALVAITPKTFGLNQGLNGASSGRAALVSGGSSLFAGRPVWGYGPGSFVHEYRAHHPRGASALSASHTIPITIAAEQGAIGELAYLALVIASGWGLLRGSRADPVRAGIAAAFLALVFHTLLYADFLEDPLTWALLGVGCALAPRGERPTELVSRRPRWASRLVSRPAADLSPTAVRPA